MTVHLFPTDKQLLKSDEEIPQPLRGQSVLLRFAEAVPSNRVGEFYRVQFTESLLRKGETDFRMAEVVQPQRVGVTTCKRCRKPTTRKDAETTFCVNRACEVFGKSQQCGPVRGVVRVMTFPDHVDYVEEVEMVDEDGNTIIERTDYVSRCLLIFDRRYDDAARVAIVRAAAELCSGLGWRLKD